jgi:lactoylglutathione lyase
MQKYFLRRNIDMLITGVDHITINVNSLEESKDFYENVLGLKQLNTIDMGDHIIVYFQLSLELKLELIKYKYNTTLSEYKVDTKGIYRHFAISVSDLDELYNKLKVNNINIVMEIDNCEKLKFRNILIKDPSGVEIEFVQPY